VMQELAVEPLHRASEPETKVSGNGLGEMLL